MDVAPGPPVSGLSEGHGSQESYNIFTDTFAVVIKYDLFLITTCYIITTMRTI